MLDTICNVFGGMILMAILVVIQTQASVARIPKLEEQALEAALDARKVEFEIQQIEDEVEDLERRKRSLDEKYAAVPPNIAILVKECEMFRERKKQAEKMLKELEKDKNDADREFIEARKSRNDMEKDNRAKRVALARLEEQLERERQLARRKKVSQKQVRLPIAHDSKSPRQRIYLIEGNRAYQYPEQCIVRPFMTGKHVSPKGGDGSVITSKSDNVVFLRTLESIRPSTYFITLFVAGTNASFETFQTVRRLIVDKGFDCGYGSYDSQKGLFITSGEAPVQ